MRINSLFQVLPIAIAAQFAELSSKAQVLRPVETDALHAPSTNSNKRVYIMTAPMREFFQAYVSKLESIPYKKSTEEVTMDDKVSWLKIALPEVNKLIAQIRTRFSSHEERDVAYQFLMQSTAVRVGSNHRSEEFSLALFKAGFTLNPDFAFYLNSGRFSEALSKYDRTDKLYLELDKPLFKVLDLKDYPALTNLFAPLIATKSVTATKFDSYRISPKELPYLSNANVGTTIPLPKNQSLIVFNPHYANGDPKNHALMRRAEMNELAHLLLNVYAPNFCNDDAKVITVDGVGEKFNTDIGDIAEFVSDAVNVLAGDNYDIARLWYLEAHRKTAYGAMSSRVANKIFANLQAKYKIVEGYPMCDSIPQTQEAIDAMLGILNPTKNKQQVVNEFYDDFRKAFVAVARKAMELIKAYDAKAAAQPSIINKK